MVPRDAMSEEACSLVGLDDRDGRVVWRAVCGLIRLTVTGAATGARISFPSPVSEVIASE